MDTDGNPATCPEPTPGNGRRLFSAHDLWIALVRRRFTYNGRNHVRRPRRTFVLGCDPFGIYDFFKGLNGWMKFKQ